MLKLRTLEYSPQSVVYELPPGKPDPQYPYVDGIEERPRVRQSSQKGHHCFYYSLNLIRQRIGASAPLSLDLCEKRVVEQICSLWRKKMMQLDSEFPIPFDELVSKKTSGLFSLKHSAIGYCLRSLEAKLDAQNDASNQERALIPLFHAFLNQRQHYLFDAFLRAEYSRQSIEISRWFLSSVNPYPLQLLENEWNFDGMTDIQRQALILRNLAHACMVDCYELYESTWKTDLGIKDLILKLKAKGPIFVCGRFGTAEYNDPPHALPMKFADREVFGWEEGTKRISDSLLIHAVVIVGAKYEASIEQVYYVDPNDPSDPADPSLQKIYAISYKTLVAGITDIHGKPLLNRQREFAYRGNFLIPSNPDVP
jgi:hypothetical protein